jgi:hypothetical protein
MPVQAAVRTYCPEEVSAEKLRSTRQAQAKLTARGWFARDRATSTTSASTSTRCRVRGLDPRQRMPRPWRWVRR